jgi:hypothetical protein
MIIDFTANPLLKDKIFNISKHEAGHYIIARDLGFEVTSLTINILDARDAHTAGSGVILSQPINKKDEVITYLEKRTKILLAGSVAQSLTGQKQDETEANKILESGGKSDYSLARENMQLLRNLYFPNETNRDKISEQLSLIFDKLWKETIENVSQAEDIILILAKRLAQEVVEFQTLYELPKDKIDQMIDIKKRYDTTKI